jgi:cyanophycinase
MTNSKNRPGTLIIIGGHEDRDPNSRRTILKEVARRLGGGKLVLATVASHQPEGYFQDYEKAFADLNIGELVELYVGNRSEAADKLALLKGAAGVFFSGGDQLRLTSQICGTEVEDELHRLLDRGGLIAGTSAGASMMSDTMMVTGSSSETHRIGDLRMAPGLAFIRDVIIDQHFAERGRFGRLIGAIAHNPRVLGLGIDEDTAVIVEGDTLTVVGNGGVYVVDGKKAAYSNVAEADSNDVLSLHDIRVHVLAAGDSFDIRARQATSGAMPEVAVPRGEF